MRCLIVGGTGFLGGAIADAAAQRGHDVTILSRGSTVRRSLGGAEVLRADRYGDLSGLNERHFDWVFDSCAYTPDAVNRVLDALGTTFARYVMISSISVYGTFAKLGLTEDDAAPKPTEADLSLARTVAQEKRGSALSYGASYGPLKRGCEVAAMTMAGERASVLRAGQLIGAGDYTDRLTWWVRRIDEARGDRVRVPAPAPADRAVQLIDVRDVADFALLCAEEDLGGVWNVTGRPKPFFELLAETLTVAGTQPDICWVDEARILEAGIVPWTEFPLMAPATPRFRHFLEVDTERARRSGLECRPLAQTLEPLLAWDRKRRDVPLKCGINDSQEKALLG
ncbi:MAG: NAD-dependent epimerase/dehydratase family protein [Pseudomonadota bacterium]